MEMSAVGINNLGSKKGAYKTIKDRMMEEVKYLHNVRIWKVGVTTLINGQFSFISCFRVKCGSGLT